MLFAIRANRRALISELAQAQTISTRKTGGVPVLGCVLLSAQPGQLYVDIQTTNLDETYVTRTQAQIAVAGIIAVPVHRLYDYLRLLPDGDVEISCEQPKEILVRMGRSKTKIIGIDPSQFPAVPESSATLLQLPGDTLAGMLRRCRFAICSSEGRFQLNALLIEIKPNRLRLVATDGNRLALVESEYESQEDTSLLVARTAVDTILNLATNAGEDKVEIASDEKYIIARTGHRQIFSRRMSGTYPGYEGALPNGQGTEVASVGLWPAGTRYI